MTLLPFHRRSRPARAYTQAWEAEFETNYTLADDQSCSSYCWLMNRAMTFRQALWLNSCFRSTNSTSTKSFPPLYAQFRATGGCYLLARCAPCTSFRITAFGEILPSIDDRDVGVSNLTPQNPRNRRQQKFRNTGIAPKKHMSSSKALYIHQCILNCGEAILKDKEMSFGLPR